MFFTWFYVQGQQTYWKPLKTTAKQLVAPSSKDVAFFELQTAKMNEVLAGISQKNAKLLWFPDENSRFVSFSIMETPVFHPDLGKKYPEIRSFSGSSLDGKRRIKLSSSPSGLSITIWEIGTGHYTFIEKQSGTKATYKAYRRANRDSEKSFFCETKDQTIATFGFLPKRLVDDGALRTYRIAVSTTGEYTNYHGGTVAGALAAINATLTRVNQVFETDLGVRLQLVANNDEVIFTDAATDPYTSGFNSQVQNTLTTIIGEENYDVGHLFHNDNDNGNAGFIGSVCQDGRKGSAFASALIPEGDLFDLDYVAHELGHQFGANHTWSFESEGTGVQVEPASGTTIMGYAGIVAGNNVAPNGDDYFHHASIVQIQSYLQTTTCATTSSIANQAPNITPLQNYVVPQGTAFALHANATDGDGDVLTYCWEQIDDGIVVTSTFGPDNISGANFRSLPPTTSPERYFPQLSRILDGALEQINPAESSAWESVSTIQREMDFSLTVRDNNLAGGQVTSDTLTVSTVTAAGPFVVVSQDTDGISYPAGSVQEIRWNVANTNLPPINAEEVDIFLSHDAGLSFDEILAQNIPNTGSAKVQLPAISTSQARVMVKASNSIFLAVNSAPFVIEAVDAQMDFASLSYTTCSPDALLVPFTYETSNGFSETMTFDIVSDQPFTAVFNPATASVDDTGVDLTLGNIENVPPGSYTIEVVGTGSNTSISTILEVVVLDANLSPAQLSFPENGAINTAVNPLFTWQSNDNFEAFDIEIAVDEGFSSVIESASTSFPFYKSENLQPEMTYYWRVRAKNECGAGTFGPSRRFTTTLVSCNTFEFNDGPIEISSNGTPTVTAAIFIAEQLQISAIKVTLGVTHTFVEDLTISLISPSGTKVPLISRNCGSRDDIDATFEVNAAPFSCSVGPTITGIVAPLGDLSSFVGESTLGEWTLEIVDNVASDGGALSLFSIEVCAEGTFRPDDDGDGVFDDGDDLCLGTPKGTVVDTSGCPLNNFPVNNFTVSIQSESCRIADDGALQLIAFDESIAYSATLSGIGFEETLDFGSGAEFTNLSAGMYQLCINGSNETTTFSEQCFDITVEEPESLSVLSDLLVDGSSVRLQLSGGQLYNITLNGLVQQTLRDEITLELRPGLNELKVTTGVLCQGIFEERFFVGNTAVIAPNPANDLVKIGIPFEDGKVEVYVFAVDGKLISTSTAELRDTTFDFDTSYLRTGTYFMVLQTLERRQTLKLVKQ